LEAAAIAEDMEKKINGTTAAKRRFRNISPKGFKFSAFVPRKRPRIAPNATAHIRINVNRHFIRNSFTFMFYYFKEKI
jgi:hypothetical protein